MTCLITFQDFNELVHQNILVPCPIERTKIPTVYPVEKGKEVEH